MPAAPPPLSAPLSHSFLQNRPSCHSPLSQHPQGNQHLGILSCSTRSQMPSDISLHSLSLLVPLSSPHTSRSPSPVRQESLLKMIYGLLSVPGSKQDQGPADKSDPMQSKHPAAAAAQVAGRFGQKKGAQPQDPV